MKIVATIEVQLGAFDEESPSQQMALEKLKRHPENMIEMIWDALEGKVVDLGIHSPHVEEGDI